MEQCFGHELCFICCFAEQNMDLRWRLSAYLAIFFGVLLVAVFASASVALREDVEEEIEASVRMVELMRAASLGDDRRVETLTREGVRHLRVGLSREEMTPGNVPEVSSWIVTVAEWIVPAPAKGAGVQEISVGGLRLFVAPNPVSEISEIVEDVGRWAGTILAFAALTIGMVWFAVGRALAPARELEARIATLDNAEGSVPAPHEFALQEFNMLSRAVDDMAGKLAAARAARRSLSQQLISVQENERREIARELHDEFGQSLTAISLSGAYIARHGGGDATTTLKQAADDICAQADHLAQHLRGLLSRLRPHGLDSVGLIDTMRDCVRSWEDRRPDVVVRFDAPDRVPVAEGDASLFLYRGLQEALTNIARHSAAKRVDITLARLADEVVLSIVDDGAGLASGRQGRGFGLMGLGERAAMVGGHFDIQSAGSRGCRVVVRVPVAMGEEEYDDRRSDD